ncbi:sigma-70 family RNA polymerase sigma factor [Catellatospora coxensis]|uniref:RNA polymerase sigma factor n=2 Tax=Catellatospora coxensis TaxID=310354 RepID=A0A8J3KVA0_9ACTN|nr:RNA polymerase sigma factor SigL [Catellatospora coxensis]
MFRAAAGPASTNDSGAGAGRTAPSPAEARMQLICQTYAEPLLKFLMRLSQGRPHTAEDLLQETLLRAWRHIDQLPGEVETLGPWLYTVARRVAIDAARARQIRPAEIALSDTDVEPVAGDLSDQVVSAHVIRDGLAQLTPEHREVLVELYFRQRSAAEAAARLGIATGTVKSRAYYALRALGAVVGRAD